MSAQKKNGSDYSYVVLGAGKQGLAAAYDVIRFGHAARLTLADSALPYVRAAVNRLKQIAGTELRKNKTILMAIAVDARKEPDLRRVLQGHDAVLSALPYYLNPGVARAAIADKVHY